MHIYIYVNIFVYICISTDNGGKEALQTVHTGYFRRMAMKGKEGTETIKLRVIPQYGLTCYNAYVSCW